LKDDPQSGGIIQIPAMQGAKVLIIEDDVRLSSLLKIVFEQAGAVVNNTYDGSSGLRQFWRQPPDLVIVDLMLPEMDGWEVCRTITGVSQVPIIIISAIDSEDSIVKGLELEVVDYVTKPFRPKILLAKANAALRRSSQARLGENPSIYCDDHLEINLADRRLSAGKEPVSLTRTEFRLLEYLFQNAGKVLTYGQILDRVWDGDHGRAHSAVHVYISRLRRKMERNPRRPDYLMSEYGVGYRLELPGRQ
jgi:DNA-binding response OmpR family regulator